MRWLILRIRRLYHIIGLAIINYLSTTSLTSLIVGNRIRYFALTVLLGHILVYQYIRDSWLYKDHHLTIVDLEEFHIRSPLAGEFLRKSYLPLKHIKGIFPNETFLLDQKLKDSPWELYRSLNEQYDPRLLPTLMLNAIHQSLVLSDGMLDSSFTLPFSWNSFLDLQSPLSAVRGMDCHAFGSLARIPKANLSQCETVRGGVGYPKFKIMGPVDHKTSEVASRLIGYNYLLHSAPLPHRICFLEIGPGGKAIVVPVSFKEKLKSPYKQEVLKNLILQYVVKNEVVDIYSFLAEGVDFHHQRSLILSLWYESDLQTSYIRDQDLKRDKFRVVDSSNQSQRLSKQDFMFELEQFYSNLQRKVSTSLSKHEINDFDTELFHNVQWTLADTIDYPKFFHEVRVLGNSKGAHFDWRFFKSTDYSRYETQAILHQLTRAWLKFAHSVGLQTWLAHGTLLGWYWNGMNLPWDLDLDVQMTTESLILLARNYNQTLVVDGTGTGAYLVEVGPSFYSRVKGSGQNIIDARFIDVHTGFYVDITALSFTDSSKYMSVKKKASNELNQLVDEQFLEKQASHTVVKDELYRDLTKGLIELYNNGSIFNCRNNHFYSLQDLTPLQPVIFEGVTAYVPPRYTQILQREYNKALLNYEYAQHRYRPVLHLWIPSKVCRKDTIGNRCFDRKTLLEAKTLRLMTSKGGGRGRSLELEEVRSVLVDPWTLRRSQAVEAIMKSES